MAFENIVGKGENHGNQHFLLFSTMFSTLPKQLSVSKSYLIYFLNTFNLYKIKNLQHDEGLTKLVGDNIEKHVET